MIKICVLFFVFGLTSFLCCKKQNFLLTNDKQMCFWDLHFKKDNPSQGGFLFLSDSKVLEFDYANGERIKHDYGDIHGLDTLNYKITSDSLKISYLYKFKIKKVSNDTIILKRSYKSFESDYYLIRSKNQSTKIGSNKLKDNWMNED